MSRRFAAVTFAVVVLTAPARGGDWLSPLARAVSPHFRELDDRRAVLAAAHDDATIPPGSPSTLGYHSRVAGAADRPRWVEIDLGRELSVDSVVLFPATAPPFYPSPGFYFPPRFKVELSARGDWSDAVGVADYTDVPPPFPTNLPVVLPAGGRPARKVRLTATRLTEL
ncbi:MAG: discoidin domain-containing protein, partial [Fimbriiglobus sp.]